MAVVNRTKETLVSSNERKVKSNEIPVGTNPLKREITEVSLRNPKEYTSYTSKDGEVYTFQTHTSDEKGRRPVPHRNQLALFLCMREVAIGGDPSVVMDAFNLQISDVDNKVVYPISKK